MARNRYDDAQDLCGLLQNSAFANGGNVNREKIQRYPPFSFQLASLIFLRKVIMIALGRNNLRSALKAYNEMPSEARDAPLTRYLMYRVALQENNADLGAWKHICGETQVVTSNTAFDCLHSLCQQPAKDSTLLYACVLEAQTSGDRRQAIAALQEVTKKFNFHAPEGVHLPALLRCISSLYQGIRTS